MTQIERELLIQPLALQAMDMFRTLVDRVELNFAVCDAYYYSYSYSYFCVDSFDYVEEVAVVYPMVAYPMVRAAVVASDCISLHWNAEEIRTEL